jgi:hypothetical protein
MATPTSKKRVHFPELENATRPTIKEGEDLVPVENRRQLFWNYMGRLKRLEELEIEMKKLKEEAKEDEKLYPELLQAKGCQERAFRLNTIQLQGVAGIKKWIHAETIPEARKILGERVEKEAKDREKKKQKMSKKDGEKKS